MSTQGSQIILIDDEIKMTKYLKILLEEELGCVVEAYNDPIEAHKRLQEKAFDVISLDYRMPKMTGVQLLMFLKSVRNINAETPVIMFTAFLEEIENFRLQQLEKVLFLEKPVGDEQYIRNIKIALQMKRRMKVAV